MRKVREVNEPARKPHHPGMEYWKDEPGEHQMILLAGDTAWNPVNIDRRIPGPALVVYRNGHDESIRVVSYDLPMEGKARATYIGQTMPDVRPPYFGLHYGATGWIMRWDAGYSRDGEPMAMFEWKEMPGLGMRVRYSELEVRPRPGEVPTKL